MSLDIVLGLAVAGLLFCYLLVALARPERF